MTNEHFVLRKASDEDMYAVAEVARQSRRHFLSYLPDLHSPEEDKSFFRTIVFEECDVWVVEDRSEIVGFCAFKEGWLDHLYFLPSHVGKRLGQRLLAKAKDAHSHLQLWVFQQNTRAIRFYERHGFVKVRETDGSDNEERVPDALFEWRTHNDHRTQ